MERAPFVIAIDTREQCPLSFGDWPTATRTLPSGDYSIVGYESLVAIERKSLPDLFACVGRERDRFERELLRLARLHYAALVVEGTLEDVLRGVERSQVSGAAAVGSLAAWSVDYRLPVFFAGSRVLAAGLVRKLLTKWFKATVAEPLKLKGRSKL